MVWDCVLSRLLCRTKTSLSIPLDGPDGCDEDAGCILSLLWPCRQRVFGPVFRHHMEATTTRDANGYVLVIDNGDVLADNVDINAFVKRELLKGHMKANAVGHEGRQGSKT